MTEKQIKQLAVQSEKLKEQLDFVNNLKSKLEPLVNEQFEHSSNIYKYDVMSRMYSTLLESDMYNLKNTLIKLANDIIEEKESSIEEISLLTILSEIEKG